MAEAIVVAGGEDAVAAGLRAYLDAGMDEVMASVFVMDDDRRASLERMLAMVGAL